MKAWWLIALMLLPGVAFAADTNRSAAVTLQSFRILSQRNIFDPTRRGGSGQRTPRRYDASRLARAEGFSLVGTMTYGSEALAFFNGSDARYKKVLQVSNTIGDYKVTEVGNNYVKLAANGNEVKMPVGVQLKKLDEGNWELVDGAAESPKMTEPASPDAGTNESRGPEPTGNGSTDSILKKLMQAREKELNK